LAGEVSAADAQRFHAVGEGLVGANTAERYVRPVLIELLPGAFDRTAAPTVLLLVAVVGGLFACVALDSRLGLGDGPGGVDRRGLAALQPLVERTTFGAPVSSEGSERADLVEVAADVVDRGFGSGERPAGHRELADRLVELASSIGRLTVEVILVGCDQLT
jgi:hypothetical protein